MRTKLVVCMTLISGLLWASNSAGSVIDVTTWLLRAQIQQTGVGNPSDVLYDDQNPPNPYSASHSVSLLNSMAAATYNFAWNDQGFAHFLIENSQAAAGSNSLDAATSARIYLTAPQDTIVTFSGYSNYVFGAGDRSIGLFMSIFDEVLQANVITRLDGAANYAGDPPTGTIQVPETQFTLAANHPYYLYYVTDSDSISGPQSSLSISSGQVVWDLAPVVPEPATAGLLAVGSTFLTRRRRTRVPQS